MNILAITAARSHHGGRRCSARLIRSRAGDPQKAGIKGLVIEPWFGVFVPADTRAAIVARAPWGLGNAPASAIMPTLAQRERVRPQITSRFPLVHGAPGHIGLGHPTGPER
jgi:uncharacterized protein YcsI (UPF0317 family)